MNDWNPDAMRLELTRPEAIRMANRMRRWEWARAFIAWAGNYFWLPCPLCSRLTSGFEWKDRNGLSSHLAILGMSGTGICPACTLDGRGDNFDYTDDGQKIIYVDEGDA